MRTCCLSSTGYFPAGYSWGGALVLPCSLPPTTYLKTALSPDVTFVYLYNPFLSNTQIACLEETFSRLKSGSKILNVGFPLDGWIGGDTRKYVLKKSFEMSFDWGRCTAYLHQVSDTNEAREGRKQWLQKFRKKG